MAGRQGGRGRRLLAVGTMTGLAVSATAAGTALAQPEGDTPRAVVDWSVERQTVDGFGGSWAFHKAGSVQRLGDPLAGEVLDMIFDVDQGIGLDIVRVMVGDGGIDEWGDELFDGPSETIQPDPGPYVWDRPDWDEVKDDFDAYQIWLMQEAQARGVETILASVWSPPAWMKENESVTGSPGGLPNRLRPDMYQEFADYLAAYVQGYSEHFGIEITHLSPTNEPDLSTSYSSSEWSPAELSTFVGEYLGPTFEAEGIDTQIVVGETVGFHEQWVLPSLLDPGTEPYVDVVAAHAYTGLINGATTPRPEAFEVTNQLGKPVWQTEYMNQGAPADNSFQNNTISDGLRYATLISNMFETSSLNAYFWWWPVANNGADGSDLIRLANDGTPQSGAPTETGEFRTFKRYYTIGQYSRFISDGYVVIEADHQPVEGVTVSAFKEEETGQFTIVVVNTNEDDLDLTVDLEGGFPLPPETKEDCKNGGWREFTDPSFRNQGQCVASVASGSGTPSAVVPYRTSASENMRQLEAIGTVDRSFTATLRGQSVTTFVPSGSELPELPDRKDVFSTYLAAENDGQSPGFGVLTTERGEVVTDVSDGSFLRYANVNFADGSAAGTAAQRGQLRIHAEVAPRAGGAIEVRLGDPGGTLVGTMAVPSSSGEPGEWITVSTDIDTSPGGARGFHDLYLVFTGGHDPLFDIELTRFSD
ncbi:glycoside hydrolase [Bogoriella caseilytica]|uniref:Glucuronoarabinoxylan endo-1,4-beta-xylanase n=1 Tax=Bogoriella caseilytica TaxID=56055 RepID=A0A3N2BCV3_9MICO|nr:glycoside hydrolase [Bogoriella caseilytica]ROR73081.1 glucuronoarabinoxylan endo-1,4-beta-xylanase [Bogoriella caseilytica]